MAVFCLKNFHSRFLLFINALPLKEQTDCANGEKTRSTPSHPQALVQEDGNVALGVLPKDRPTSQSEMVAALELPLHFLTNLFSQFVQSH